MWDLPVSLFFPFPFFFHFWFKKKKKKLQKTELTLSVSSYLLMGEKDALKQNELERSEYFSERLSQNNTEWITMPCSAVVLLFCSYLHCVINSVHPLTQYKAPLWYPA